MFPSSPVLPYSYGCNSPSLPNDSLLLLPPSCFLSPIGSFEYQQSTVLTNESSCCSSEMTRTMVPPISYHSNSSVTITHSYHPFFYPSEEEMRQLCEESGLTTLIERKCAEISAYDWSPSKRSPKCDSVNRPTKSDSANRTAKPWKELEGDKPAAHRMTRTSKPFFFFFRRHRRAANQKAGEGHRAAATRRKDGADGPAGWTRHAAGIQSVHAAPSVDSAFHRETAEKNFDERVHRQVHEEEAGGQHVGQQGEPSTAAREEIEKDQPEAVGIEDFGELRNKKFSGPHHHRFRFSTACTARTTASRLWSTTTTPSRTSRDERSARCCDKSIARSASPMETTRTRFRTARDASSDWWTAREAATFHEASTSSKCK